MLFLMMWLHLAVASPEETARKAPKKEEPWHRISYECITPLRYNTLGSSAELYVHYRYRLFSSSSHILLRDAHVGATLMPAVTPADAAVGGEISVAPLSIIRFAATVHFRQYLGTYDFTSYESARDEYWKNDDIYSTSFWEYALKVDFRIKVGPIALLSQLKGTWFDGDLRGNDVVFYNPLSEMMAPNNGWAIESHTNLVYLHGQKVVVGARLSILHSLFEASHYLPAEPRSTPLATIWRVGPIAAYTFEPWSKWLQKPTLFVILGWYGEHPYLMGQKSSRTIPYAVLGFTFQGDLFSR